MRVQTTMWRRRPWMQLQPLTSALLPCTCAHRLQRHTAAQQRFPLPLTACIVTQPSSALRQHAWPPGLHGLNYNRLMCGAAGSSHNESQELLPSRASAPARQATVDMLLGCCCIQAFTIPTLLTISRVVVIPFVVAAWYWSSPWSTSIVTLLFVLAALTDWLDGYLARKLNASSEFGAFLDPVADKLMVAAVLVLLSTQPLTAGPLTGNHWMLPVCTLVILGREISMSALREWAAGMGGEARNAVAVNSLGKWKTATQMASLTLLLATRDGGTTSFAVYGVSLGAGLLVVATYLTAHSLVAYSRSLWRFMV
ncbi:hypothetical protein QJQ45_027586 [Haematococcus lacustris]|nr:hypothetical protein QJQ45_027586 [Haematococcus lacustris]